MSPPRRRSARLASSSQTPRASQQPRLGSVIEGDEEPEAQSTRSLDTILSSHMPRPTTPASAAPIKLAMSEMHPSKFHQTMAPPSSGLKFGFVDIHPDDKSRDHPSGINQTTPSKTRAPSGNFTFRVASPVGDEMNLGPEARQMMERLREDAARHRAIIAADREKERLEEQEQLLEERKIAKAKGKIGRFSDVHMKEFKKMDSIAARSTTTTAKAPSFTPLKSGMKRSQSKADLGEPESSSGEAAASNLLPELPEKRREQPVSPSKRLRQGVEDDTSSVRPLSRDISQIPRPKSSGNDAIRGGLPRCQTSASLLTPTKASAAKASNLTKTPTIILVKSSSKPGLGSAVKSPSRFGLGNLTRSPTRPDLPTFVKSPQKPSVDGSLKKSVTMGTLVPPRSGPSHVQTPGRFDRVKSILKRQFSASKPKSHLPQAAGAAPKTPSRMEKEPPSLPMTTPGQRFGRHVEFTPDTKQAALSQNSPSPTKSSIPRSKTLQKLPHPQFRSLGAVMSAKKDKAEVAYPDLSAYGDNAQDGAHDGSEENAGGDTDMSTGTKESSILPDGVPGTFTFRSDHTIRFDSVSPTGFGAAAGQSSLRQVRASIAPAARMPGAFPIAADLSSRNKENKDPVMDGIPHGMANKKRHRAVWDDEEIKSGISHGISNKKRHRASSDDEAESNEGVQRGAKKLRKTPAPAEGQALLAPKLAMTPSPMKKRVAAPHTSSPAKKGISLSRLNMLARPKNRK